ncbi:MAG TPA: glutamyl-tRNA reductase [Actinomycetales bacterium]|nr:glutamyl-tRNA reductase [Actinomycetales bacterium]
MSVLVVGLSHHTAPIEMLERASLDATGARRLARDLLGGHNVHESVVLSTCNRLEVYAEVAAFHGGVADVGAGLAHATGLAMEQLTEHLYVRYAEQAVSHLFEVTSGLDSMAIGESQVLGQVRTALRRAQDDATVGRVLDPLLQRALRVGKRTHSETALDRAGHSLVEAGLSHADTTVGDLAAARALVVGAGAMSALAVTTLHRLGARQITVANRTADRAARLAESVDGEWLALEDRAALADALSHADVVLTCTGAVGYVLDLDTMAAARQQRGEAPQLLVDLALPRDVAPPVADLDGVTVVGLAELGEQLADAPVAADLDEARAIVVEEVENYLADLRAEEVAPTVVALRGRARQVVDGELARLRQRLGESLPAEVETEVVQAVNRVVDKLLHTPTVRVKTLAAHNPEGANYAAALRELFDLDLDGDVRVSEVLRVVQKEQAAQKEQSETTGGVL